MRRGTNSIAPMTATSALLSSFVRAVLTWRLRPVTSNCKQLEDTSSTVSPLIARTTPKPLRSRRHHLHFAQPCHHRPSQCITLPRQESGVAVESKFGKPILSLTPTHSLHIARIFRSESEGEVGKTIEGGGGSLQTVAGGILPLHPLIGYFIAD